MHQRSSTYDRVIRTVKKVRQVQRILMGADAPIPPVVINAAASKNLQVLLESVLADATTDSPAGRPRGESITGSIQ